MERKISVAIPYYNNSKFMNKTLETLLVDKRINEIIITDDMSKKDISTLKELINNLNTSKIKLFENVFKNLYCYHNKITAVIKCSNDGVYC